jgi:hypothetical protein
MRAGFSHKSASGQVKTLPFQPKTGNAVTRKNGGEYGEEKEA